jgi:adenylate cyclase
MVEQLRLKERIRETFGKYIDPRVVEGLIDRPVLAADGQRRVMTVLFCDVKGFTSISEGMTPQGLVKVMNRYLSIMSQPIRNHRGIIDKYIGDAIMAYWGPPFTEDTEQARLACLAALDIVARVEPLQAELPELLGVRNVPIAVDLRIGIAMGSLLWVRAYVGYQQVIIGGQQNEEPNEFPRGQQIKRRTRSQKYDCH